MASNDASSKLNVVGRGLFHAAPLVRVAGLAAGAGSTAWSFLASSVHLPEDSHYNTAKG